MKKIVLQIIKWLIPALFGLAGIVFYAAVHGHGFLGLISLGICAVILCYYALFWLGKTHKRCAKILCIILTALLALGCTVFAVTEIIILDASTGADDQKCDYIIVLGAKVNGTSPSVSLSDRLNAAYDYLTRYPDAIAVLSGGQGPDEDIPESLCMFQELTARGIDPERLWQESSSTSTWENLKFSMDIIEEKTGTRPTRVGVLSSEYHLFRAGLFAKDCGIDAVGIPAATSWPTIRLNYFLREVAGVWHYLILGGQYQ